MSENHIGKVIQVTGPVLDIRFKEGELPDLHNAIEIMMIYALIPVHIYQIFFPAGVMEQGGIKAGTVQKYRF